MNEKRLTKILLSVGISLILVVVSWNFFLQEHPSGDENFYPSSLQEIQTRADNVSISWQHDAQLISVYGGEYGDALMQDLHPSRLPTKVISPQDNNKNDGKCYFWTFFYYSSNINKFYEFSMYANGTIFWISEHDAIKEKQYQNKTIAQYVDSSIAGKKAVEYGGKAILDKYPCASVFYWLFKDSTGNVIWVVYYVNEGMIVYSIDFNAETGDYITTNGTIYSKSSDDFIGVAYSQAKLWRNDAKLVTMLGRENNDASLVSYSMPDIYALVLYPPDNRPGDGRCPLWVFGFISNSSEDIFVVWVRSDTDILTSVISRNETLYPLIFDETEASIPPYGDISVAAILNSTVAAEIAYNKTKEYEFMTYEFMHTSKYEDEYDTTSIWILSYSASTDAKVVLYIDAENGEIFQL